MIQLCYSCDIQTYACGDDTPVRLSILFQVLAWFQMVIPVKIHMAVQVGFKVDFQMCFRWHYRQCNIFGPSLYCFTQGFKWTKRWSSRSSLWNFQHVGWAFDQEQSISLAQTLNEYSDVFAKGVRCGKFYSNRTQYRQRGSWELIHRRSRWYSTSCGIMWHLVWLTK